MGESQRDRNRVVMKRLIGEVSDGDAKRRLEKVVNNEVVVIYC